MNPRRRIKRSSSKPGQSPRPSEPRRIGDVLVDLLAQRGYAQTTSNDDCLVAWQDTAGELSQHSLPGALKRGVLQINVRNSAVLQELTFRKQELLAGMRRQLPHHRIADLRFRIGCLD
jgi:predicted nucleic acid-binding Zn ribbon protein